ncbi:MAG TPA: TonB family protein [Pyrinomonadaceae bacterium]|nr:TonB family protein [Pyrinomonadaceae bacterium]
MLDSLALLRFIKGDDAKAEALFQRALSIREKNLGVEHKDVIRTLRNLAEFYQVKADYKKAEPLYQRIIAATEKSLGATHQEVTEALQRYACLLRKSKREEEAEKLDERVAANLSTSLANKSDLGEVINGTAISKPAPAYPEEAKQVRASGTVRVQLVVDETGKVIIACAVTGHPLLRQAAERAAYGARFTPTLLSGQPVKVSGIITYNFVLR